MTPRPPSCAEAAPDPIRGPAGLGGSGGQRPRLKAGAPAPGGGRQRKTVRISAKGFLRLATAGTVAVAAG